ncbi:MAG: hypothetical protein LH645_06445 [Actinomycetia bacterium]|nr:hypothetical protein [Actinomycetes bacterium]
MGDAAPAAAYGMVLLAAGAAYSLLVRVIISSQGEDSLTARAMGRDTKGLAPVMAHAVAIPAAYASVYISYAIFVGVAILWVVPDRRIERVLAEQGRCQRQAQLMVTLFQRRDPGVNDRRPSG